MDNRAGARRRLRSHRAVAGEDAGEGEVHPLERLQRAHVERGRRRPQRFDQLVGALVALAALADAAVDDLLQMIAAGQPAHVAGAEAHARIALDQHAQQLSDLIHVVARLPLRRRAGEDVARCGERVESCRAVIAAMIALLANDAEVAELQPRSSQTNTLSGVRSRCRSCPRCSLPSTCEDAGDLAASAGFTSTAAGSAAGTR